MNNIRHLNKLMVFVAVAQKGSFTQAAQTLGITKSAASQHIRQLESAMGMRVLNRSTRGVSLTALGEKLLLRCQLLEDQVEQVFAEIANASGDPQGRFAVTFPHSLEMDVVIPALEQLCNEYPRLEPVLIASDNTLDLIANQLDVALHVGALPDSSYRAMPVGTMTEIFCATPRYLNRHAVPQTLADLAQHRWIATAWQTPQVSLRMAENPQPIYLNLNPFARVSSLPSALALALRHLGLVLLPDVIAKPLLKQGEMVQVLEGITGPQWPIFSVHAYGGEKPIHISRFNQLICRYFALL